MPKLDFLPNKKTYITGTIMITLGLLSGLFSEWLPAGVVVDNPAALVLEGIGFITVRKGIASMRSNSS